MVSQGDVAALPQGDPWGVWASICKPQPLELDARSDGSARTVDEAADLEGLDDDDDCCGPRVSGLPLVCSNCGVSFFSLQIPDDQVDCYCSGECKWSVIMYREMDLRMVAVRRQSQALPSTCESSSLFAGSAAGDEDSLESLSFSDDDAIDSYCC